MLPSPSSSGSRSEEARALGPSLLDVVRDAHHARVAAALFFFTSFVYFLTAPGRIDIVDGALRFDVAHNLLELGRPVVTHALFAVQGPNEEFYAFYPFGSSVLALPFVQLARVLAPGSIDAEQFAYTLATIPFAAANVALGYVTWVRLGLSGERALRWSLVLAFGSMLWVYAGSSFDLAQQAFFLTAGVVCGAEALLRGSRGYGCASGLAFGALTTVQEMYFPLAVFVLLAAPRLDWRALWRNLRSPAVLPISLGLMLGVASVLAYNSARFDDPFSGRQVVPHPLVGNPLVGLAGLFVSPAKSVFLYSPLHVLGLVGLVRLARSRAGESGVAGASGVTRAAGEFGAAGAAFALPVLGVFVGQVALVSTLAFWAGEWAWGPRYLVATSTLVIFGAPFAFAGARRVVTRLCVGLALVVQLLSVSVDHHLYYANKNFLPYFWLHDRFMFEDSPLWRRPSELVQLARFSGYRPGMKLVPGVYDDYPPLSARPGAPSWVKAYAERPRLPRVVTSTNQLPPEELRARRSDWSRDYYVLNAPRPWVLWAAGLPAELRPVPLAPWLSFGLVGSLASAFFLFRKRRAAER